MTAPPAPPPQDAGGGIFHPKFEDCQKWLADSRASGATYTEPEARGAWLALSAAGWMWGRNPVVDWRAALERQIQTDRERGKHGIANRNGEKPNPRNFGVCKPPPGQATTADVIKRRASERETRYAAERAAQGGPENV